MTCYCTTCWKLRELNSRPCTFKSNLHPVYPFWTKRLYLLDGLFYLSDQRANSSTSRARFINSDNLEQTGPSFSFNWTAISKLQLLSPPPARIWVIMFGISYGELFLILGATAALIGMFTLSSYLFHTSLCHFYKYLYSSMYIWFVGPKDLPKIARTAGRLVGRSVGYIQMARGQFDSVMQHSQATQVLEENNKSFFFWNW